MRAGQGPQQPALPAAKTAPGTRRALGIGQESAAAPPQQLLVSTPTAPLTALQVGTQGGVGHSGGVQVHCRLAAAALAPPNRLHIKEVGPAHTWLVVAARPFRRAHKVRLSCRLLKLQGRPAGRMGACCLAATGAQWYALMSAVAHSYSISSPARVVTGAPVACLTNLICRPSPCPPPTCNPADA